MLKIHFYKNSSYLNYSFFIISLTFAALVAASAFSQKSFAWGERGHHEICLVATHLVKSTELKRFLTARSHTMGHLCNIPDIHWRQVGEKAKAGSATHFIDIDALPMKPEETPIDLNKIITQYDGHFNKALDKKINIMNDYGTLWWRYDQFYRLALAAAKKASEDAEVLKAIKIKPALAKDTDIDKKDYNKHVLQMITNMGLMGHFIGDASQPYHNTADYDGWHSQHGGIHAYYETDVVNEFGIDFEERMLKSAKAFMNSKTWKEIKDKTPIEMIKKISTLAYKDLAEVQKLDKVLASSAIVHKDDNKTQRLAAKRKLASETYKSFERLVLKQTAWSAAVLAATWDKIYKESGSFNLTLYRSYDYPLAPEFVGPDYGPKTE